MAYPGSHLLSIYYARHKTTLCLWSHLSYLQTDVRERISWV
jgi:hypothetical protein